MTESFHVQNQILGTPIDLHLFKGVLVLLALAAIPLVITSKDLLLTEQTQTVFDWDTTSTPETCTSGSALTGSQVDLFKVRVL